MSDILGNVGKVFKDAAKKTMKVSGDAVELTKTSVNIKLDESKRENFLREIGAVVYENYKKTPESACAEIIDLCKCLDEIEKAISEQKSKLANISNKKYCVGCGIKLEKVNLFCHSCGAKQPEIVVETEDEKEENCGCFCCCDTDADNNDDDKEDCCGDSCCDSGECTDDDKCDCESEPECQCPDKANEQ